MLFYFIFFCMNRIKLKWIGTECIPSNIRQIRYIVHSYYSHIPVLGRSSFQCNQWFKQKPILPGPREKSYM